MACAQVENAFVFVPFTLVADLICLALKWCRGLGRGSKSEEFFRYPGYCGQRLTVRGPAFLLS
jgi:hypothetical protein